MNKGIIGVLFAAFLIACSCNHEEINQKATRNALSEQAEIPKTLPALIEKSLLENKNLFLVFGFEKCGWCRIFDKYHHDPEVIRILSKYYIVSMIDYDKTPQGKELYRTYGSAGFPSWVILDCRSRVLLNSEAPISGVKDRKHNIGYPAGDNELAYYIHALKTTSPSITWSECNILKEKLKYYHNIR
jgi:thioredoxin-related protein